MVALVQRVRHASVEVDGETTGSIQKGLLVLLGVHRDDSTKEAAWLARKCAGLRIFADRDGKMNLSLTEAGGEALVVSQFTLYGDVRRGYRPSFDSAAEPIKAESLYRSFIEYLEENLESAVETGVFGALMDVHIVNDGPVTLWIERLNESSTLKVK